MGLETTLRDGTSSVSNAKHSIAILPSDIQKFLLALAKTQLPKRIGSKYAEVIKTYLIYLDSGNKDFGDESEFQNSDRIVVGVKYVENVYYTSP